MDQIQTGEYVKLQKPDIDTFTNVGQDEEGNNIGNCSVCNMKGVLIDDHVCQTMVNFNEHYLKLKSKYQYVGPKMVTKIKWFKEFK
jgi:hypothetical protein